MRAPCARVLVLIEWAGSLTALVGAFLLALNSDWSGFGFVAFLVSNLFWMLFGVLSRMWGLLTMQIGFTATSILGIWQWFFTA